MRKLRHVLCSTYRDFQSGNTFTLPLVFPSLFIVGVIVSMFLSPIFIFVKLNIKVRSYIYIRDSSLVFGLLVFRLLASNAVVKIVALPEDEERRPLHRALLRVIAPVIDRFVISRSKFIATPSPLMFRDLCLRRGLVPRRVILVPPGVD